jgi:hypothetical protein
VVTVYKQKIDFTLPIFCRVGAEFLDPNNSAVPATLNRSVCRALHGVNPAQTAEVKRIYQPEGSITRHRLAQPKCGGTLGDSDLHESGSGCRPFLQRGVFSGGVLAQDRTKT